MFNKQFVLQKKHQQDVWNFVTLSTGLPEIIIIVEEASHLSRRELLYMSAL